MAILRANKDGIRELYIAQLQAAYPFYTEGSRSLAVAYEAVDAALAGNLKLSGNCWERTLETYSLPKNVTRATLRDLPETAHSAQVQA